MPRIHPRCGTRQQGMTLVELMVAMALGLIVIAGAISLLLANRQSSRTGEGLSQVQESARSAFELLSRDIREAGSTGCDNSGRIANVLNSGTWWGTWYGIRGFDGATASAASFGTGRGERVAGTQAVQVQGIVGLGLTVETHNPTSAEFKINATTTDIVNADILMVCDFDHAAIFQVTNYNSSNVTVVHNAGTEVPGNCAKGLGYPTPSPCTVANSNDYQFKPNSQIAKFAASEWYIGNSGRTEDSGRSLFRRRLGNGATVVAEEIVADVTRMQILYRVDNAQSFVAAGSVAAADWLKVNAVTIVLTVDSADTNISTDKTVNAGRLQREFTQLITLRNRVP